MVGTERERVDGGLRAPSKAYKEWFLLSRRMGPGIGGLVPTDVTEMPSNLYVSRSPTRL